MRDSRHALRIIFDLFSGRDIKYVHISVSQPGYFGNGHITQAYASAPIGYQQPHQQQLDYHQQQQLALAYQQQLQYQQQQQAQAQAYSSELLFLSSRKNLIE